MGIRIWAQRRAVRLRDKIVASRPPDVLIGGDGTRYGCYMARFWLLPRNKWLNVYLHHFMHSDDDRALHDHPWFWLSFIIDGSYVEVTRRVIKSGVRADQAGDTHEDHRQLRHAGSLAIRRATASHRVELLPSHTEFQAGEPYTVELPCWTIFITGPKLRIWGFHCPKGWVPWQTFTGQDESNGPVRVAGNKGPGCGED